MKILTRTSPILLSAILFSCVDVPPPKEALPKTTANRVTIVDDNAGSANVDDLLTGTYEYTYAEGDTPESVSSLFRWLRNGEAIADATGDTYQLVAQDNGQKITFEVTPVLTSGVLNENKTVSAELEVNAAPSAIGVLIVDDNGGVANVGDQLTGHYIYTDAETNAENTDLTAFAWYRDETVIEGATATQYTLVAADGDHSITFAVASVASEGSIQGAPVVSSALLTEPYSTTNTAPTVSDVTLTDDNGNNATIGDELTVSYTYTDAEGDLEDTASTVTQWFRNSDAINHSLSSYTLTDDDIGQSITVKITPAASSGIATGSTITSNVINVANNAVNTGPVASNVSITDSDGGTTIVGHTLVASYQYADLDNDPENTSETVIQWLRNGANIDAATNPQYTLTHHDSAQYISVKVTPAAQTGVTMGESVTAAVGLNVTNSLPVASNVVITPNTDIAVGVELTASYTYSDLDHDDEDEKRTVIQWYRGGSAISGATSNGNAPAKYTLVAEDSEQNISVKVTPASDTSFGSTVSSAAIHVDNSAPIATQVEIVVYGDFAADVGRQLRASYVYVDGDNDVQDLPNTTLQWFRDGAPIPGAIQYYYNLTNADAGFDITHKVTPAAATGSLTGSVYTSNAINVLNTAPTAMDDEAAVAQNATLLVDVIANDNEPEAQAMTVSISTTGEHGSASVVDGKVQYVPEADFFGTDTVIYQVEDPFEQTATAVLTVYVRPVVVSLAQVLLDNEQAENFITVVDGTATFPIGAADIIAGQFNDDPYDDLVVSNPDYDRTSGDDVLNNTGAVLVIFGNSTGNTVNIADIEAQETTRGTLYLGDIAEDNFGAKVTMIQTSNASPRQSIVASAPFHDSLSKSNNGSVYVIKPEHISGENYTMTELIARNSQRVYELKGEDDNEMLGTDLSSFSYHYNGVTKLSVAITSEEGLYLLNDSYFEDSVYSLELGNTDTAQPGGHFSDTLSIDGKFGRKANTDTLYNLYYSAHSTGMNQNLSTGGRIEDCPLGEFAALDPTISTARSNSNSNTSVSSRDVAVRNGNSVIMDYGSDCNHSYKTTLSSDQSLAHAHFDSVGDINLDGNSDFVITLPSDTDSSLVGSGRAYVIFGGLSFNSFNLNELATGDGTKGFVIEGAAAGELLGSALSEGFNFNGDANQSFALGAPAANSGNGRIYLIHGNEAFGKVIQ